MIINMIPEINKFVSTYMYVQILIPFKNQNQLLKHLGMFGTMIAALQLATYYGYLNKHFNIQNQRLFGHQNQPSFLTNKQIMSVVLP